jgi:hypothetical protein
MTYMNSEQQSLRQKRDLIVSKHIESEKNHT